MTKTVQPNLRDIKDTDIYKKMETGDIFHELHWKITISNIDIQIVMLISLHPS